MGKSRLPRGLITVAERTGAAVLRGRAIQVGGRTPLGPIAEAVLAAARLGRTPNPALGPFGQILAAITPQLALHGPVLPKLRRAAW